MGLERNLNAAELHATRNRVSVSPDLIRRLGGALGYNAIEAFGSEAQTDLSKVFDLGDIIDLMLLSQLRGTSLSSCCGASVRVII